MMFLVYKGIASWCLCSSFVLIFSCATVVCFES